jgi:hypothetical protein
VVVGVVVGGVVVGGVVVGGVVVGVVVDGEVVEGAVVGGVVVVGGVEPSDGSRYSRRFGEKKPGFETRFNVAIEMRRDDTSEGVSVGNTESSTAAAPATCGEAIEVPVSRFDAVSDVYHAERIPIPGAKTSRHEP